MSADSGIRTSGVIQFYQMGVSSVENFIRLFEGTKKKYKKTKDASALYAAYERIAELYGDRFGVGDLILGYGEELIDSGSYDVGIELVRIVERCFKAVANQTLLCIRLAEWEFENGNAEKGKTYLQRLACRVDNYEESIAANELTDVWNKYRMNLDLPKSVNLYEKAPLSPDECTLAIEDIMQLPQDELLLRLSEHLNELCAYGERTELLSVAEQTAFYIDEFIEDMNSDGLSHYLYYRGDHYEQLLSSVARMDCPSGQALFGLISKKFPQGKIPRDGEKIQSALEKMEKRGIDFEDAEQIYFEKAEKELLSSLIEFVTANSASFR